MKPKRRLKQVTELSKPTEPSLQEKEVCLNPWNGVCKKPDITVYIYYSKKTLPICRECWREIASTDVEWRYN